VMVERLGSSAGDETELRRESTKAMRAQEEQGTLPTDSTAAAAAPAARGASMVRYRCISFAGCLPVLLSRCQCLALPHLHVF